MKLPCGCITQWVIKDNAGKIIAKIRNPKEAISRFKSLGTGYTMVEQRIIYANQT